MSTKKIAMLAHQYVELGKNWHFHILTPGCMLNNSAKYVLVLENVSDHEEQTVYSDEPYMDVGEELVKLLHGNDVVKKTDEVSVRPLNQIARIVNRAKELSAKNIFWHHHMLFPGCKYNIHGNKFVIVFEDKEIGEVIESISDHEPKSDLQRIEGLFYSQKK